MFSALFRAVGINPRLEPLDEAYVLGLFERPDLTVIVKGLAKRLDPTIWNTRYLAERCGTVM